jgi:hypothetical protein
MCNRTFEDTFTFCLVDGAILSAPFDPLATQQNPTAQETIPPTLVMPPQPFPNSRDALPPTIAAPQAEYAQPPSLNNALLYQQSLQSSQEQPTTLKVPWGSRVLACVLSLIVAYSIEALGSIGFRGVYLGRINIFSAIAAYLLNYGVLGFLFGYKWPQGGWKWGLWLTALPGIFLALVWFENYSTRPSSSSIFFPIFFLLLLPLAARSGALWGSKTARRKRAG